ncbi:MAG: hypothetical protein ABI165_10760 [Bryobacteraceae bacterium]
MDDTRIFEANATNPPNANGITNNARRGTRSSFNPSKSFGTSMPHCYQYPTIDTQRP